MEEMEHRARVEYQEKKDQLESLENQVPKVNEELLEMLVFQVLEEVQVLLVTEVDLVAQVCEDPREKKEAKDLQVQLGNLDLLVLLADGVKLVQQAPLVQLVHQVLRVLLVFVDHLVLMVLLVERDQLEHLERMVSMEQREIRDLQVNVVNLAELVQRGPQVNQGYPDEMARLVHRVTLEQMVHQELLASRVRKEIQDQVDLLDQKDQWESQVWMVTQGHQVLKEQRVKLEHQADVG